MFDLAEALVKVLADLARQQADVAAEAGKPENTSRKAVLDALLACCDRVTRAVESVRPEAEDLKRGLAELERAAAKKSSSAGALPEGQPLSEARIHDAIHRLMQLAAVAPPLHSFLASAPQRGDVQAMDSNAWRSVDDPSSAHAGDVRDIGSGTWGGLAHLSDDSGEDGPPADDL